MNRLTQPGSWVRQWRGGEFPVSSEEETSKQLAQRLKTQAGRCGLSPGDKRHLRKGTRGARCGLQPGRRDSGRSSRRANACFQGDQAFLSWNHGRTPYAHDLPETSADGEARRVTEPNETEGKFFPRGAIFFFALLLVFYALLWLVIYWLMIARS